MSEIEGVPVGVLEDEREEPVDSGVLLTPLGLTDVDEGDVFQDPTASKGSTQSQTSFNLINSMLGSGILALAYGMAE
ncbi:hypothetical protein KIPB_012685, partial [Kipferlia bialata]|eukprot:g12685.t1